MTTDTTQSVEELEAQVDDLRTRHEKAIEGLDVARDNWNLAAERFVRNEIEWSERQEASTAFEAAQAKAETLAVEVEKAEAAAQEGEREEQRNALIERGRKLAAERSKADKRRLMELHSFVKHDAATSAYDAELRLVRADLAAYAGEREQQIRLDWRNDILEMERNPPRPGWEPNYPSLERRLEDDIAAMRQAVAAEVDALVPEPDDGSLAAFASENPQVAVRLLDPATRRALADGGEFVTPPRSAEPGRYGRGSTSVRLYSALEMPVADARHDALVSALLRLGGQPGRPIGPEGDARNRTAVMQ